MKKAISSALAAALIILSPGLSCYEAAAASFGNRSTRAGGRATNLNKIAVQQAAVWNKRTHQIAIKATSLNLAAAAAPSQAAVSYVWSGAPRAAAARSARSIGEARMAVASLQKRVSTDNLSISGAGVSGVLGHFGRFYDNFKARALSADPVQGGESSDKGGLSKPSSQNSKADGAKDAAVPAPAAQVGTAGGATGLLATLKQNWSEIRSLPHSFNWRYIPGWGTNAFGQEIQAVALDIFTAMVYDVPTALLINGIQKFMIVPGAWIGSFFMNRYHPNKVNMAALISVALSGGAIALVKSDSPLLFKVLVANALIQGFAYGVTRGIAENLLPKMIFGSLPKDATDEAKKAQQSRLETGLNWAYLWVEIGAIVSAMLVAEPLLHRVGGNLTMGISSAITGLAALFYARIRFADKWSRPQAAAPSQDAAKVEEKSNSLPWTAYLPLIYARFNHFLLYGVSSTILALSTFSAISGVKGRTIGFYDGGSMILSFLAAIKLVPQNWNEQKLTALMVASVAAFLWSPVLFHSALLTMILGGVMGGVITVTTNKWISIFQESLPPSKLKNLSKWVMTWSVLSLLPLFAAVGAIQAVPAVAAVLTMPVLYKATAAVVTAAGVLMLWLTRGAVKTAPKK